MKMLKNGISERLDFEIFWGSMPPDPAKSSRLWRFRNCLGYQKTLTMALTLRCYSMKKKGLHCIIIKENEKPNC